MSFKGFQSKLWWGISVWNSSSWSCSLPQTPHSGPQWIGSSSPQLSLKKQHDNQQPQTFSWRQRFYFNFMLLHLIVPFLMNEETLKFIPGNPDKLTLLFVFILSNCTRSMILSISSGEGDKSRRVESFSISLPVFWGTRTNINMIIISIKKLN